MKRIMAIFILILCVSSAFAQFYKDYPDSLRKDLAESYYFAGERYIALGFEQGERYKRLAFEIYPGLNPSDISPSEFKERNIDLIPKKNQNRDSLPSSEESRLAEYRFVRFIAALGSGNAPETLSLLDSFVRIVKEGRSVPKELVVQSLFDVVDDAHALGIGLDELYAFGSIRMRKGSYLSSKKNELVCFIRINKIDNSDISIKTGEHRFGFTKAGNELFMSSIEGPVDRIEVGADTSGNIKAAFGEFLDAFLSRNFESLTLRIGKEIAVMPMQSSITRKEIMITFTGYFNDEGLRSIGSYEGIYDPGKAVVKNTLLVSSTYPLAIYRLEPNLDPAKLERIPFFARYKKYYFTYADNAWLLIGVA
jgi:hypothetical protein